MTVLIILIIVEDYKDNKNNILKELKKVKSLEFKEPMGAFYFYLNIKKMKMNSVNLSNKILMQTGVVFTPGIDFDKKYGSEYVRLAFSGKKKYCKRNKKTS